MHIQKRFSQQSVSIKTCGVTLKAWMIMIQYHQMEGVSDGITFFAWDFAGEVQCTLNCLADVYCLYYRRSTLLHISVLSLRILCMFCVGELLMEKMVSKR